MTTAAALLAGSAELGRSLAKHPFVVAAGDGTLASDAFDRWLVEDYFYVVEFRRFLALLAAAAPTEEVRDLLLAALVPLRAELELFRTQAAARQLSLCVEPAPTTLGYASYLHASLLDGFEVALAVLYGAEKAYYDAWAPLRACAQANSPYWPFINNWSAPEFGVWVEELAAALDRVTPLGPTSGQRRAFSRVLRLELRFWNGVHVGDGW